MNKKLLIITCTFMLVTANYAFAQSATFPQSFVGKWYHHSITDSNRFGGFAVHELTFTRTTIIDGNAVGGENYPYFLISTSGDSYKVYMKDDPFNIYTLTIRLINGNLEITGDWKEGTWYSESNWRNHSTE
jgi:hypothetical protein